MPFLKGISNKQACFSQAQNNKSRWEVRNGKIDIEVGSEKKQNPTSHIKNPHSHIPHPISFYGRNWKFKEGSLLIIAIIFLFFVSIFSMAIFTNVANFVSFSSKATEREQAIQLAEAGIEYALFNLNKNAGLWYGTPTEISLGSKGTFFVALEEKTDSLKTLTSTGYVQNSLIPGTSQSIQTDIYIDTQVIAFNFAVQVGAGGVEMENSATINGTVYSNANIVGSGTSTINGDAYAVFTISSPAPLITGTTNPNSDPSQMPTIDYQFWKDAADYNPTICSPTCTLAGQTFEIGPRKYIGDLVISNSAIVIVNGPIHVTGNLIVENLAQVKLNENFGSNSTVIIVDSTVMVQNNGIFSSTGATPKGYILVVSTSTDSQAVSLNNQGINAIFYALEGGAEIVNDAQVAAVVANNLLIRNSATLTYDEGLASAEFTNGPGGSWQIVRGTYKFTK